MMDFPIQINTLRMVLSIICFKGSQLEISKHLCYSVPEDCIYLSNSAGPDEMLHFAAFHLGLHCLPKYPFSKHLKKGKFYI